MKQIKLFFLPVIAIIALLLIPGCSPKKEVSEKNSQTIVDGSGREIVVPQQVDRIIPLVTGISGVLYDIGAGDTIVGVTKAAPYPTPYYYPQTDSLPDVGSIANINVEEVVALKPDIVITTEFFLNAVKPLEERDITVVSLRLNSLSDIEWNIKFLGALVGKKKEADEAAAKMASTFQSVREATKEIPDKEKVAVYVENSNGSTYGASSWCTESILTAGGLNIYGNASIKMPKSNFEYVISQNPDVILLYVLPCKNHEEFIQTAKAIIEEVKGRAGWDTIEAVQNSRFCIIDDRYLDFGPNQVNSVVAMAKAFYPEKTEMFTTPEFAYISAP